jgi:hypothetical protein
LVHAKKVTVFFLDLFLSLFPDSFTKIEVNCVPERPYPIASIDPLLGRTRGDITGAKITESWVPPFQVIVPFRFGNIVRRAVITFFFGTQIRPSFRNDSDISVNLDWYSPDCGKQVGCIWVQLGFAKNAPRLWARQIADALQPIANVDK